MFIGRCGNEAEGFEREEGRSVTFIIHYVHSKRNVRFWAISSSRDLLAPRPRGGELSAKETERGGGQPELLCDWLNTRTMKTMNGHNCYTCSMK